MNGEELRSLSRVERARRIFDFEPVGWQRELLESDSPDKSVNCGRQVGKSEVGGAIAADSCLTESNTTVAVLARWQDTADEMWNRMESHFKATGLSNEQLGIVTDNAREKEFDNGTRAICRPLPKSADAFRGKLPKVVIVDEAALVADSVFTRVLEPMFVSWGFNHELIVMSTPRGKNGYHYRKHEQDPDFESFTASTPDFIPKAVEAGVVDETSKEWLDNKLESEDSTTIKQEYLGEFVDTGDPYLPREIVEPCVSSSLKLSGRLFLGVDVAHAGDDRSVYLAADEHGSVRIEAAPASETVPEAVDRIERLDNQNGYAGIAVDATGGLGAAVDDYTDDLPHIEPVKFTSRSKAAMFQRVKRLLEGEELVLPQSERLIHELTSLTHDFTSSGILQVSHPPGGHDDHPDALALALEARDGGDQREAPNTSMKPVLGTINYNQKRSKPNIW